MPKSQPQKTNLNESLKKLSGIVAWFEEQEEIDVEKGLEYVKEGAELIKACKARLSEVENDFQVIKKDLEEEIEERFDGRDAATGDGGGLPF